MTAAELSDVEFDEGNVGEKVGCCISFGRTGASGSDTGIAGVKSPGMGAIERKMCIFRNLHILYIIVCANIIVLLLRVRLGITLTLC